MSKQMRWTSILKLTGFGTLCGAIGFALGLGFGGFQNLEINAFAEATGGISGHLVVRDADGWKGSDVVDAICAVRSDTDGFHHTYAITGTGLHYSFSCAKPKEEA